MTRPFSRLWLVFPVLFALAACSGVETGEGYTNPQTDKKARDAQGEGIFGDGLKFGGRGKGDNDGGAGIGVNGYLWRATLDTISFMPLSSADPFGGVVITDWYAPPVTPTENTNVQSAEPGSTSEQTTATPASPSATERFKVTAYILSRDLRSDGVRVSTFKQVLQNGTWIDAAVEPKTAEQLENAILTRARELRIADGVK